MWRQAVTLLSAHSTAPQSGPSGTGLPLLGVRGASALSPLLEGWGHPRPLCHGLGVVLACLRHCQDTERPAWLLGSVFGSPGAAGVWQVPSGVGEAVPGSQRVATNPGLGQLP